MYAFPMLQMYLKYNPHSASLQVPAYVRPKVPNTPIINYGACFTVSLWDVIRSWLSLAVGRSCIMEIDHVSERLALFYREVRIFKLGNLSP